MTLRSLSNDFWWSRGDVFLFFYNSWHAIMQPGWCVMHQLLARNTWGVIHVRSTCAAKWCTSASDTNDTKVLQCCWSPFWRSVTWRADFLEKSSAQFRPLLFPFTVTRGVLWYIREFTFTQLNSLKERPVFFFFVLFWILREERKEEESSLLRIHSFSPWLDKFHASTLTQSWKHDGLFFFFLFLSKWRRIKVETLNRIN